MILLATACQKEAAEPGPVRPALGKERGDCKPNKVCEPGLLCLSNLCVRPPPADCQQVADILASFDLGNYAEAEARDPAVARYKAACEKVYVSKEQGECFTKATDKAAAELCAPAMFATQKVEIEAGSGAKPAGGTADCATIAEKIRGQMGKQMGNADPQTQQMFTKVIAIVRESCEQDAWPPAFKSCVIAAGDSSDAMNKCSTDMPPALQQKMTERMAKAMQPGP